MRKTIFFALWVVGCGAGNPDKSTGTTIWDLGIQNNQSSDMAGAMNVDMAPSGPQFPLTLTPLTTPQTQTANISLYFQVTDRNGNGVPNLASDQFIYTEDGVTPDPSESHFTVGPLSGSTLYIPTVLVLDVSGSVATNLSNIQAAAGAIVDGMLPEQEIALMVFADTSKVTQTFTRDKTALKNAIGKIDMANVGVSTNLYGAGIDAVGMWTDGFQNDPTMTQLTTGLAIIITDGADEAAVKTLQDYITARANKRVITVGIGSAIDVSVLKEMQTAGFIQESSYASLVADVGVVTQKILTLAHSIYSANYCSPKRGGSMHELVFTVAGNPQSSVNATCAQATFSSSAPSTCQSLGDQTHTQVCQENGSNVICCPYDSPFYCSGLNNCYATAADAQVDCGQSCIFCGGSGMPTTGENGTQAGPAIHVTFDASSYKSMQCPVFWGTNCKALQGCCPSVAPTTEEASCVASLNSAQGDETSCLSYESTYCPTLDASCMAFSDCCNSYTSGGGAQTACQTALFNQHGSSCTSLDTEYCPSPTPMPNCAALKDCCNTGVAGQFGQAECVQNLVSDSNNFMPETYCANHKDEWCPPDTEPNCQTLAACCSMYGQEVQDQCYSTLVSDDSNSLGADTNCMSSLDTYCSTNWPASCSMLQACCANKTGSQRDSCEYQLINASGNDNSCMSYLTSQGC